VFVLDILSHRMSVNGILRQLGAVASPLSTRKPPAKAASLFHLQSARVSICHGETGRTLRPTACCRDADLSARRSCGHDGRDLRV